MKSVAFISFALGGAQNGLSFQAGAQGSKGKANGDEVTYNNTTLSVGTAQTPGTLNLKSGGNTTLRGATANADTLNAEVKGNLAIESLQEKAIYDSKQTSVGAGVSICIPPICYGTMVAVNVNAAQTRIKADHDSVGIQSGLNAGDGGFNVKVGGKTDLVGGQITSTDKAVTDQKNQFTSTGGITTQDLQNTSALNASSVSVNVSVSGGGTSTGSTGGMAGFGQVKDSQASTTQAGISGIAGNTSARTGDVQTGLKPVFTQQDADKINKSLSVQTSVTADFGKNSAKFVGNVAGSKQKELTDAAAAADKAGNKAEADRLNAEASLWSEGGAYRVSMHLIAGAMGGGVNGAAGAAASAASAGVLNKVQDQMRDSLIAGGMNKDVARATASLLTLGAATTLAGAAGGVQGATTGFNVDANNRQLHPSETKWIKDNAKKYAILNPGMSEAQAEKELADQAFRQVQFGAEGAWDSKAQNFLKQAGNQMLPSDPVAGNTGPGFMFYATPQQKADATMYLSALVNDPQALKFYQDNKIRQPSQTDLQSAAMRDAQIRANLGTATQAAFAAAATISLAGVPPTLLNWALANPVAASSAGIITAETAAAITSGAITPSSLAPVLAAGGVKTVTQLGEAMAGQAATATTGGFINATKVCQSACAIGGLTVEEQALALLIKNGGDAKGTQTEALLTSVAQRTGMTVLDGGKYGSNNGFDLVLKGKDGAITVILDGKQLTSSGAVQLSNQGAGGTNQLSPGWIDRVIKNISDTNPNSPAIKAIEEARVAGTLSIGVGGVNRTTGQLLVLPVTVPNK